MLKVYSTKNKNSFDFLHDALELRLSAHMSWRLAWGESWKVKTLQRGKFWGNETSLPLSCENSSATEKMLQLFSWCNPKINSLLLS